MVIDECREIIIFGAGKNGKNAFEFIASEGFIVSSFCDNNTLLHGMNILGVPVWSLTDKEKLADKLIVISTAYSEAAKQLSNMGLENYTSFYLFKAKLEQRKIKQTASASKVQLSCDWILRNIHSGGLAVCSFEPASYPEVTGYTIPTMLQYGFQKLALDMAEFLSKIQKPSGGFPSPEMKGEYYFDTAQALRGLIAIGKITRKYDACAEKAALFLFDAIGDGKTGFLSQYATDIPESVHLFSLPPMLEWAHCVGNEFYIQAVHNCVMHYLSDPETLRLSTLTHFLAYQIDGLIDLGYIKEAKEVLEKLLKTQQTDGVIPAFEGVDWVCLTGLAQIAICLYKMGIYQPADKIMNYLDEHQELSGGFLGSIGEGAKYFPDREISWAVKFYLDAYRLRIKAFFEQNVSIFPEFINKGDGRILAIAKEIRDGDAIIEIGCGKGRILKCLREQFSRSSFAALDISPAMLRYVPDDLKKIEGCAEFIDCQSEIFDVVYSVEALEHSVNLSGAVNEIARICKSGGKIIIIDKQLSEWGRMQCPPWESWPERKVLELMLGRHCDDVKSFPVMYEDSDKNDDLMIKWIGIKR